MGLKFFFLHMIEIPVQSGQDALDLPFCFFFLVNSIVLSKSGVAVLFYIVSFEGSERKPILNMKFFRLLSAVVIFVQLS